MRPRPRPDSVLRAVGVGGAGALWGLGLARLAAEAGFLPLLYHFPLAVATVALVFSALLLTLYLWTIRPRNTGAIPPSPPSSPIVHWFIVHCSLSHCPLSHCSLSHCPLSHCSLFIPLSLPLLYVTGLVPRPLAGGVLLVGGAILALLLAWGGRARWLPPASLGVVVLALYLCTLLPTVGLADTFEFQVVVPRLAVAHPTGYPLYVLLGKLFALLPLSNVAWRVNLASAVFATAAVLVLYALLVRLTAHWLPAFLAALAFAFSSTFWSQAVVAEVYTLHNLLVAAILYLLVLVGQDAILPPSRWRAIFFLLGLSLTNHLTTALLVPAIGLALLWERPRLRLKDWPMAAGLFLLGLSVYLFVPLRWPALNRGEWMTLRGFLSYATGGQFHGALRLAGWRDPVRWAIVGRALREPFGWVGVGLAALGVARMAVRQRRALALTGLTFLAFLLYGLDYYVPDISVFLLPAHLVLAVWLAEGIAQIANGKSANRQIGKSANRQIGKSANRQVSKSACAIHSCSLFIVSLFIVPLFIVPLFIASLFLPLSLLWLNLPRVDRSHDWGGYAWGRYVLNLPLAPGSAVLADVEKFAPLYYLQQIEGVRPDLDVVLLGSEELYQAELAARLGREQKVYLARYLPNLGGLRLGSVGPLVGVNEADEERVDQGGGGVGFGEQVRLLGAEVSTDPLGRRLVHLTLRWQATAPVSGDFFVRLRMVDDGGQVRWESDGVRPVGGLYPTNAWPAGAVVSDYHEVAFPPWLPPGKYTLEVGLFPPFGEAGLEVAGQATPWLAADTLEVPLPSGYLPPLPHERRYSFAGGAWLTGYNLAGEVPAGAPFVVDLSWHEVKTDEQVRLTWVDSDGQEVEATTVSLANGMPRSRHVIAAPQRPGSYTLHVGLAGEAAHCGWLAPPAIGCPLSAVEVAAVPQGLANFSDLVLLLDAQVGRASARPGGTILVALRWRAMRALDQDYTVFVHLVGPDGRLHGQVDAWPVQGTRPTSQWTPGEEVSDPYEVRLDPDALPGPYRVEVGWYLLATMQRLPVVDASGRPTGDSFIAGGFSVTD